MRCWGKKERERERRDERKGYKRNALNEVRHSLQAAVHRRKDGETGGYAGNERWNEQRIEVAEGKGENGCRRMKRRGTGRVISAAVDRVVLWWYDGGDPKSTSVCKLSPISSPLLLLPRVFFLSSSLLPSGIRALPSFSSLSTLPIYFLLRLYSDFFVIPKLNTADDSRTLPAVEGQWEKEK